jgi:hypothetical protein
MNPAVRGALIFTFIAITGGNPWPSWPEIPGLPRCWYFNSSPMQERGIGAPARVPAYPVVSLARAGRWLPWQPIVGGMPGCRQLEIQKLRRFVRTQNRNYCGFEDPAGGDRPACGTFCHDYRAPSTPHGRFSGRGHFDSFNPEDFRTGDVVKSHATRPVLLLVG